MSEIVAVRAPVENVNDDAVAVIGWLVENESFVEAGTAIVQAETTKTSFEITAPVSGFVRQVAKVGSDVPVGEPLCYIVPTLDAIVPAGAVANLASAAAMAPPPAVEVAEPVGSVVDDAPSDGLTAVTATARPALSRFSTGARAALAELGLSPATFAGRGLVKEADVRRAAAEPPPGDGRRPSSSAEVAVRAERLARSKRVEGRRLRAAWAATVPSSVTVTVASTTLFSDTAPDGDAGGIASATLIAEVGRLLRAYPVFNAQFSDDEIHYYETVNIGYALDLGKGLKVVVIRDADRKPISAIAEEKQQLVVDYLEDSLSIEALAGATFTITDMAAEGISHFTPVLNQRQAAVLGVCAAGPRGQGHGFNLVLVFDHQLSDGRTAAAFLRELGDRLVAHDASLTARPVAVAAAETAACSLCYRDAVELSESRHFLVRTIGAPQQAEQVVCTICLQSW